MILELQNIKKSYDSDVILKDINFTLGESQTLSILGRSGCGKSTLLKIIAGIIPQNSGSISVNGKNIGTVPPQRRDIIYIYQEPLLFPHLNVFENIAFGLRIRNQEKNTIIKKVNEMVDALGLGGHEKKMPGQLSGGQRQRTAFGRALIINPKILLLDEPFGNLDTETRTSMQVLFKRIAGTYLISSLFVTHDLKEALLVGDKFAYMKEGKVITYLNKHEFVNDESTGVKNELLFWKNIE